MSQPFLTEQGSFRLKLKSQIWDLSSRTYIMGVLNITPDSFSDGGRFFKLEDALRQGIKMSEEGADIIDIGGESTRPGSDPIPVEEELSRVIPVIQALSRKIDTPLCIDSYKSEVCQKALEAGACMINDISGLRSDPQTKQLAAQYQVPVVIMHIRGTPKNMQKNPFYENLISELLDYFREGIELAKTAGIDESNIIIDPGIGFGKTVEHNLGIIKNLSQFKALNQPILIGTSRKSFIGKILDLSVEERLEGSLASQAVSILNGANIIRTHDIKESVRVAALVDAILKA